MRKHLLIIIPGFNHGGTNRSLFNLLSLIDEDKYEIDILGMSQNGYYRGLLRNHKIISGNIFVTSLMANLNKEKNLLKKLFIIIIKVLNKALLLVNVNLKTKIYKFIANKNKFKKYDSVIAFQEGEATRLASYFHNRNKIAWIHCNYLEYLKCLNIKPEKQLYDKFTRIVCVSEYTKSVFLDCLPEFSDRLEAIHNILNRSEVIKQSKKDVLPKVFVKDIFKIVSVGRVDNVKRFSEIPAIANRLKNKGFSFKWFILGGVAHIEEKQRLVENIKKYNVAEFVYYLGEVDNPYPYIKNSDILVSTSLSEAFPYVVLEAKVLQVPVVVTDFPSASECLINGEEGFIAPLEKIESKIELLLKDKSLYKLIKNNLVSFRQDSNLILNKFYKILK